MITFVVLLLIFFVVPFLISFLIRGWQSFILTAAGGVVLTILAWNSGNAGKGAGAPFGLVLVIAQAAGLAIGLIAQAFRLWLTSRNRKASVAHST